MSLTLPKNKKLLFYFAFGLAGFLLALTTKAYYTIEGCPDCGAYTGVVVTTGGTGDLMLDTDFVSSASFGYNDGVTDYWNIAERFVPFIDTRVCAVRAKIQYDPAQTDNGTACNPPTTGEQQIRLQISTGGSFPSYSTNYHPTAGTANISTCVSDIDPIAPPSQQVPAFVWFQFSSCWTAYAWQTYWFEFSLRNTGYQQAKFVAYQTAYNNSVGAVAFGQIATNSWLNLDNNWSFEIINNLSQGENEPFLPPATSSYGFTDKDFGLLGNMFRDVIVWLFFPDQANLERFGNLWDTIRLKPPIGYFTAAKDELALVGVGTANIAFDTTAAAGIITPLRTGIIVILWVLFAFWIFHRLRNLDL